MKPDRGGRSVSNHRDMTDRKTWKHDGKDYRDFSDAYWPGTERFELKEKHLDLLRKLRIYWEDYPYDTGAPTVNSKRPYGNSWVERDVADILGMETGDRLWVFPR